MDVRKILFQNIVQAAWEGEPNTSLFLYHTIQGELHGHEIEKVVQAEFERMGKEDADDLASIDFDKIAEGPSFSLEEVQERMALRERFQKVFQETIEPHIGQIQSPELVEAICADINALFDKRTTCLDKDGLRLLTPEEQLENDEKFKIALKFVSSGISTLPEAVKTAEVLMDKPETKINLVGFLGKEEAAEYLKKHPADAPKFDLSGHLECPEKSVKGTKPTITPETAETTHESGEREYFVREGDRYVLVPQPSKKDEELQGKLESYDLHVLRVLNRMYKRYGARFENDEWSAFTRRRDALGLPLCPGIELVV